MSDLTNQPAQPEGGAGDYPGGTWTPEAAAPVSAVAAPTPPLAVPVVVGVVAGAAAAVAWYFTVTITQWQIGFLAVGVGFVVGTAMRMAARGVGGRRLQIAAAAITLVAMLLAEWFLLRSAIGAFFVSEGDTAELSYFLPPGDMVSLMGEYIGDDPLTLLFWVIALVAAWRTTAPASPEQLAAQSTYQPRDAVDALQYGFGERPDAPPAPSTRHEDPPKT